MRLKLTLLLAILLLVIGGARASNADMSSGAMELSASQIASVIDKAKGKRAAVFIYASWCPYCRKTMPDIIKIAQEHKGQVITIAVDQDNDTLKRYLDKNFGAELPFTPIRWDRSDILARPLARFGIKPGNGIPFTALLDEYGYVHKQGVLQSDVVRGYLSGK